MEHMDRSTASLHVSETSARLIAHGMELDAAEEDDVPAACEDLTARLLRTHWFQVAVAVLS